MGYWKSKVLPKIKKVFDKNGNKKAAAEACKSFDDSKVSYYIYIIYVSSFSKHYNVPNNLIHAYLNYFMLIYLCLINY